VTSRRHVAGPDDLAVAAQAAGLHDERVPTAIRSTSRDAFVPARYAGMAYADQPVPISHGQVTSQPSLIAAMVAALDLTGTEKVLEAGTGYQHRPLEPPAGQAVRGDSDRGAPPSPARS
jgi:protein-L-isoaspartate(D-aspartate) O-methyltransferase